MARRRLEVNPELVADGIGERRLTDQVVSGTWRGGAPNVDHKQIGFGQPVNIHV